MCNNKIIDLFCGCGGLSLGFEEAGFSVEYAIDMWGDAIKTYNFNRPSKPACCEDIKKLDKQRLLSLKNDGVIGIIGGPPCQGFSTVGKRDINDSRNSLYLEYCRVVETIEPLFFVLENVKGLTTLSGGAFKDDIIKRFTKLGYSVSYKILDASDYGVPQRRQRVFFVGLKGGNFVFPTPFMTKVTSEEAISDLPPLNGKNGDEAKMKYSMEPKNSFQEAMRDGSALIFNHQITHHSEQTIKIISLIPDGGKIADLPRKYWDIRKYNKAFERMASSKPSNTVDTGHRNYFHYSQNRIPTVRENCRLQSFPDTFIVCGSKTSQYKQIGNAVPPLLAKAIAEQIISTVMNGGQMDIIIDNASSPGASFTSHTNETILGTYLWMKENGFPIIGFKEMRTRLQTEKGINDNNARNIYPLFKNCGFIDYEKGDVDTKKFFTPKGLAYVKSLETKKLINDSNGFQQGQKAEAVSKVNGILEDLIFYGIKKMMSLPNINYTDAFRNTVQFIIRFGKINREEFAALLKFKEDYPSDFLEKLSPLIDSYRNGTQSLNVTVHIRDDRHGAGGSSKAKINEGITFLTSFNYFSNLLIQAGLVSKTDDLYFVKVEENGDKLSLLAEGTK